MVEVTIYHEGDEIGIETARGLLNDGGVSTTIDLNEIHLKDTGE